MAPDNGYKTIVKIMNEDGTRSTLGSSLNDFKIDKEWFNINSDWYQGPNWNDYSLDAMRYCMGVWDKEERNDNMNILELYEKRLEEEIDERYKRIITEEYENLDVVKEYNELINTFNINMEQLADKYNNNNECFLIKTCYTNDYAYELSHEVKSKIHNKYINAFEKEMKDLHTYVEEVRAVMSLSNDKEYQLEVLKNYDVLDKKGKLNI